MYESNQESKKTGKIRIWLQRMRSNGQPFKPGIQEIKALRPFPGFPDSKFSSDSFLGSCFPD